MSAFRPKPDVKGRITVCRFLIRADVRAACLELRNRHTNYQAVFALMGAYVVENFIAHQRGTIPRTTAPNSEEDCNLNLVADLCELPPPACTVATEACLFGGCSCDDLVEICCLKLGGVVLGSGTDCKTSIVDCNGNGVADDCDIAIGTSPDLDGNGIPDECEVQIPAVSEWSLIVLTLFLTVAGTVVFRSRRASEPTPV